MSTRRIIATKTAPTPKAPYNQAIQINDTLYMSGQIGQRPETMQIVEGGVVPEARQALTNMGHVLKAADCTYDNIVKMTVLLADINDFAAVNEVYKEFFTSNYPARAAYQVGALPRGARIEIEAVAVVGKITNIQSKL